jgi:hypothetical protein
LVRRFRACQKLCNSANDRKGQSRITDLFAVLRSSRTNRPHRCGQQSTAKTADYEFKEAMMQKLPGTSKPDVPYPMNTSH